MTDKKLQVGKSFWLPIDAITQTFAILAKRGVGKTYTGSVHAEEMLKAGAHVVVLDPTGAWWGLRSSADGKSPGFPIVILGGDHGDVPLESTAGETIANFVVEERVSVVLDLQLFRKNEQARFVTDFLETLYRRNREAIHVFVDEADAFAPQRPMHGQERMLGAVEDIVRRGRIKGIGCTLITQRSAVLNKNVLTQSEVLIALRTIAPQDQDAVDAWIQAHDVQDKRETMMASLASLPIGTAWYWSPGWLDIFKKVEVRERETFNSSATPKPGEIRRTPKTLADVDLSLLQTKIAATIEKAKQEDPRELRKTIANLQAELKKRPGKTTSTSSGIEKDMGSKMAKAEAAAAVRLLHREIDELRKSLKESASWIERAKRFARTIAEIPEPEAPKAAVPRPLEVLRHPNPLPTKEERQVQRIERDILQAEDGDVKLKAGARRMLEVLAAWHPEGRTRAQVATLAGISPNSGTFSDYLSALRSAGLIEDGRGGMLTATAAGVERAGSVRPVAPSHGEIVETWMPKLKAGARRMLQVLMDAYPGGMSRQELAERAEISSESGTFSDYLSLLRRNGLLEDGDGEVKASEALYP